MSDLAKEDVSVRDSPVNESPVPESPKFESKIAHKRSGKDVVLIPQPSDDPEDPLVSWDSRI